VSSHGPRWFDANCTWHIAQAFVKMGRLNYPTHCIDLDMARVPALYIYCGCAIVSL
jgi:hypothetical protein